MFFSKPWKDSAQKLKRLYARKHELENEDEEFDKAGNELELIGMEIESLIEGPYAEKVFLYYSKKKPDLIRIHTGEVVSWQTAFGDSFDEINKSLRHSLVGLVEGGGRYKIK